MLYDTLLSVQPNQKGSFVSWLEKLGLRDLISRYSLPKLIEWGWLDPQYRVTFPSEYFEAPTFSDILNVVNHPAKNDPHDRLLGWGESWQIDDNKAPLWFLHPFCRPDSDYNKLLSQINSLATPNVYFFYHWQAYALIDVARTASMGDFPILNTPDIEQDIARISNCKIKPSDALNQPHRWGGFAKPMTWLSHYRAFRDALPNRKDKELHKYGAEALADYLEIDAETLEIAIKEQLLQGLAGSWLTTSYDCQERTFQAWPYLQKDIFFAVQWLCALNGKSFGDYLKNYGYSHNREVWPPLHKVLPFECFEDRQYFLSTISNYKFYKGILPTDEKLEQLVARLQQANYPFDSMLNAFRQLHEHLMHKPKQKGSIDFRVLRPLDYYSLLAIRAETCLRHALESKDLLQDVDKPALDGYIKKLAEQKNVSQVVISRFKAEVQKLTKLHETPENPIEKIMNIELEQDTHLVQAFLCCILARNYFAHHTYLDKELMQHQQKESAFMLIGILVTVLKLLDD